MVWNVRTSLWVAVAAAALVSAWLWHIEVPHDEVVRVNGVVLEYDPRSDQLGARVDELVDSGPVAIPDWNGRPAIRLRRIAGIRANGYCRGRTGRQVTRKWAVKDVVVLTPGTRVLFGSAKWPVGDLHLIVERQDYSEETQAYFAARGIPLWTGEVVVKRR
jgi:hypothetical protein